MSKSENQFNKVVDYAGNSLKTSYRMATADLRFLPSFIIIGGLKCGSTSLYEYLCEHPKVERAQTKELFYFDKFYEKGARWYQSNFEIKKKNKITGEASPHYIHHPQTPHRIKKDLPDVKLIAVLRNPVDRLFSHYKHNVRNGWEDLEMEAALAAEEGRLKAANEATGNNPNYRNFDALIFSYFTKGIYAEQLKRWYDIFPKNQILVLQSERLFDSPEATMQKTHKFLGLEHVSAVYEKHNAAPSQKKINTMKDQITERYKEHNEALYDLIGERFDW